MSGRWAGSQRRTELPPDWPAIRARILDRDAHRCRGIDGRPCGQPATDVDHIGDRHDHSPSNLQALCRDCHGRKSAREGNAARWAVRERRPVERHPGLLGP